MNKPRGVSGKAAALHFNITVDTINDWDRKGWLVRFSDRSIDLDSTATRVDAMRDPFVGGKADRGAEPKPDLAQAPRGVRASEPKPDNRETIFEAKRRKAVADADAAEMTAAKMRSELVALSAAEQVFTDRLTKARVNIEAIPTRIAAVLAGMTDPVEIRDLMRREIETALMAASAREDDDVHRDA